MATRELELSYIDYPLGNENNDSGVAKQLILEGMDLSLIHISC